MDLKEKIRSIENFPEEGVIFRDITTLLKEGDALREAIDQIQTNLDGVDFDLILGPESRGFIFGMPLAYNLKKGFVPVRKKGKLPAEVISKEYALEYGTAVIEVHKDAIQPGQKVVIVDFIFRFFSSLLTRIIAILMISAAVPWIGAFIATRSPKLLCIKLLDFSSGTGLLRPNNVTA